MEKVIVFFGQRYKKGEVLPFVLKALRWVPQTLVVIDGKIDNIESFQEAVGKFFPAVRFIGTHYKAIEILPRTQTKEEVFEKKFSDFFEKTKSVCSKDAHSSATLRIY